MEERREPLAAVRRPIRWKIFGIAATLLVMMIFVTLSSSLSLRRVGQQLEFLSSFYITLDQSMGDVRTYALRELVMIERLLDNRPDLPFAEARKLAAGGVADVSDCENGSVRATLEKAGRNDLKGPNRQLVSYEFVKLCASRRLEQAAKLIDDALGRNLVLRDPAQLKLLAGLQQQVKEIPRYHDRLHVIFENYFTQHGTADKAVLDAMRTQLEENRRDMSRSIGQVTRAIHNGTRESAAHARQLERRAQWLSWIVTAIACALGVIFAFWVSRNLVRPVLDLLRGTRAVENGNLDVKIDVKTSDEIAQLAGSFNHMVGELRQKEQIKEMFGKYVDPRVVQGLIDKQGVPQAGERRLMTVFFSDLQGFTTLSERLTPDGLVKLLNHYFTTMANAIRAQNGIIDKYIGDSVMAFWGPPFTGETEHARLACLAALDQRVRMEQFVKDVPEILGIRSGLPTLRVRMGISTGDVTVGSIGSDDARSYTVIGDTVNLASRLEGVNKQYKTDIIISEDTHRLAQDILETRELDSVRVVGRNEPVRLYELLAKKGQLTPEQQALRDRFSPALAAYRAGQWDTAEAAFKSCLEVVPTDGPSSIFLERVAKLRSGGTAQWEGVWNLSEK
jgi:class 3 adenylate cyclase